MIRYRLKEIRVIGVDDKGGVLKYIMKLETPGVYPRRGKILIDYTTQLKSVRSRYELRFITDKMGRQEAVINAGNEIWTEVVRKNKKLIYISKRI